MGGGGEGAEHPLFLKGWVRNEDTLLKLLDSFKSKKDKYLKNTRCKLKAQLHPLAQSALFNATAQQMGSEITSQSPCVSIFNQPSQPSQLTKMHSTSGVKSRILALVRHLAFL